MKSITLTFISCLISFVLLASAASAHVKVLPEETAQGSYEVITLRIPSEKEIPTVKVEVTIPADAEITRFEPKPGWSYTLTKDAKDKIVKVTWAADGNGLSSTEFGDFRMQGKIGADSSTLVWKTNQVYKDGSVVEWTGAPDSQTPAPVMQVKPKYAEAADGAVKEAGFATRLPICLSAAALVLALISLCVSIRRRSGTRK